METKVRHTTEAISGKDSPLTVTRQLGLQEIVVSGEAVQVADATIFESPLGTSRCFTRVQPEAPPEERAVSRGRILEAATQAMLDQGIW